MTFSRRSTTEDNGTHGVKLDLVCLEPLLSEDRERLMAIGTGRLGDDEDLCKGEFENEVSLKNAGCHVATGGLDDLTVLQRTKLTLLDAIKASSESPASTSPIFKGFKV